MAPTLWVWTDSEWSEGGAGVSLDATASDDLVLFDLVWLRWVCASAESGDEACSNGPGPDGWSVGWSDAC